MFGFLKFLKREKKRLSLKGATDLQVFDLFHHAVIGLYDDKYSCAIYGGHIIVFSGIQMYQGDIVFAFDELRGYSCGSGDFVRHIQGRLG